MKKSILSGIMSVALLIGATAIAQEAHPKHNQEVKKEAQAPKKEEKKETKAPKKEEKKEDHKKKEASPKKESSEKSTSTKKHK